MKLGLKLLMAPLLTAMLVLAAGEINTALLDREAGRSRAQVQEQIERFKTLAGTQTQLGQISAGVYRTVALMASLDDAKVKAQRADLAKQVGAIKSTLGEALSGGEGDNSEQRAAVAEAQAQMDKYLKAADNAIDLASVDPNTGIAAMQQADSAFEGLSKTMGSMVAGIDASMIEAAEASRTRARNTHLLLGLLGLLSAAAAVFVAWRMQRQLVGDLASAADMANTVAGGNLSVRAESSRADEVGDLLRALDRMALQLNDSLRTVMDSSHSIQTASTEIASGNQDLSQRTEQTASRLQQAASSMSELTGTVRQSADAASTANQLASNAAQVAQRGGEVVSQVVATMDEINASSKKISDIIGVIDGIAFQTNILALNAAVEAARAGEQGRGFAVVAGEVRSLAQRSAAAAKEIKDLIGASVEKVETGARLVQDAGTTMSEIVASVGRVTDIIAEIRASTVEQSEGIGTVNGTVGELDQMTQQNAALVEQSAAAAESLKEQAGRLSGLVSGFQLEQREASQPQPQPRPAMAAPAPAAPRPTVSAPRAPLKKAPAAAMKPGKAAPAITPKPGRPAPAPSAADSAGGDWETF